MTINIFKSKIFDKNSSTSNDPITTEIIRNSLNSAAEQMKKALIRSSFSPIIYEVLDFASAIYDKNYCMLAQSPSLPGFMGTLSFCVEEAVKEVGGEDHLFDGDIIIYNNPYGSGSHSQDAALVKPVFLEKKLIGYTAIKAHWLDTGGKEPYSTDTVDVFQEGTIYPGLKLYKKGELVEDIYKLIVANTRVPKAIVGDLNAQLNGVIAGANALKRIVTKFGYELFYNSVFEIYNHGEKLVRKSLKKIPNGTYAGFGQMDSNGVDEGTVKFKISIEVKDSNLILDFTEVPDQQNGPINCPLPSTVSKARVAFSMMAGNGEQPNEGFFRPLVIKTKKGSMFDPISPAPCFLNGWPGLQVIEIIYKILSENLPQAFPASSGGCLAAAVWWGKRDKDGEPWADGAPHPVGQGGFYGGDGVTSMHHNSAGTRISPTEIWESRNPWLIKKIELAKDSCGAGEFRGGLGLDLEFEMLEDTFITTVVERTKFPPWGINKGKEGRANNVEIVKKNGEKFYMPKKSGYKLEKGDKITFLTGGGGGYGDPYKRKITKIKNDLKQGYLSKEYVIKNYKHYN
ncbi:MAG: Acetophenone carboxylase delta subunit [Alphaproteobacteria bacterium MarineAlpha5_Bin5]|nr:MAG: Acetophenone carboxylase delta subunit [Alphaproteobacteria bacterium MarineAlpha5_Bin5]PPR52790.1 MAG: Acetophenone carboxylase delta subunit [Alphaproteobacteria bacterium MarineAlpha5_Bin4]|tara:strand:- start:32825 stop:34531 length:1707 start_codon:yes stop_codon:yes gene_type:complete